jgi:Trk K+ transport system NAD-binding subunit
MTEMTVLQIALAVLDTRKWIASCSAMTQAASAGKDDREWFLTEAENMSVAALMRKVDLILEQSDTTDEDGIAHYIIARAGELAEGKQSD